MGIIFDIPVVLLEIIFNLENVQQIYFLKHF